MQENNRIRIAVSSCLLGNRVRYDGRHSLHEWIAGELAQRFELIAVCPEVGIGLGTPRMPIRLSGNLADPGVIGVDDSSLDVTRQLKDYAADRLSALPDISGYIFKARSPSCGLSDVPVYDVSGEVIGHASGVYAQSVISAMPDLPVVEETVLYEHDQQKAFIGRVLQFHKMKEMNNVQEEF